ncbi:hypothetical protein C7271_16060 [filamentous cyanobacterium CCP5]|nr:hypothetical protein C7271_16060 [filamentous cyanobacterium CCP5]
MAESDGGVPVQFEVQLVDENLSLEEKDSEVEALLEDLQRLSGLESASWRYLKTEIENLRDPTQPKSYKIGLAYELPGDRLWAVLKRLCRWIERRPVEMRVQIQVQETVLHTQTRQFEDLDCVLVAADYLLPPQRTFVAAAQRFARTGGEFTPAEAALLEDLRFRLEIKQEDAEWYMNRALGPYRTQQQKLDHYAAVLDQEITRRFPLSEESWTSLKELAEGLNLPSEKIAQLNRDRTTQLQSQIEAERQRQAQIAERNRREQAEREQQDAEALRQQQQAANRDRYRREYRRAIVSSLFPREFDHGRLKQAQIDWEISDGEAERIAEEETAALYGSLDTDKRDPNKGADYSRLRQLLWEGAWQEADEETEQVLLACWSQDMQPLTPEAAAQISCIDLRTIDDLWSRYSNGQFGLSVQWQIYTEQDSQPRSFQQAVGWQGTFGAFFNRPRPYSELQFNLNAPRGHLPTWRWGSRSLEGGYQVSEELLRRFMSRLSTCLPVARAAPVTAGAAPQEAP